MNKIRQKTIKANGILPLIPNASDLLDHEIDSLERMVKIKSLPRVLSIWKSEASTASRNARNNRALNIHLRFKESDPKAGASDPPHLIELVALINASQTPFISYGIAIGRENPQGNLGLRKFHFDFELGGTNQEIKPIIHLQTPGRDWPALLKVGYNDSSFAALIPKLDKPRIPCLPISFSMLIHIALLEYISVDRQIETLIKSNEWQAIVASSEKFILKNYLYHSLDWLNKDDNRAKSLISYFYR